MTNNKELISRNLARVELPNFYLEKIVKHINNTHKNNDYERDFLLSQIKFDDMIGARLFNLDCSVDKLSDDEFGILSTTSPAYLEFITDNQYKEIFRVLEKNSVSFFVHLRDDFSQRADAFYEKIQNREIFPKNTSPQAAFMEDSLIFRVNLFNNLFKLMKANPNIPVELLAELI